MSEKASPALSRFRMVLWSLVVIAALAATVMFFIRPVTPPGGGFGGDFALASTQGGTFTQEDLKGTPSAVFFGYTFCPDVCPTTLAELTSWRNDLALDAQDLQIVFVTVDPDRDTLDVLKEYVTAYSDDIIGLTGAAADVEAAKAAFGVYSAKAGEADDPNYLVDHTASVFLMGRDGQFEGTIAYGESRETALAKLRRLTDA